MGFPSDDGNAPGLGSGSNSLLSERENSQNCGMECGPETGSAWTAGIVDCAESIRIKQNLTCCAPIYWVLAAARKRLGWRPCGGLAGRSSSRSMRPWAALASAPANTAAVANKSPRMRSVYKSPQSTILAPASESAKLPVNQTRSLSESLRYGRQTAPRSDLRASRQLSGHPRREPVFAQYWPFPANSRVPGRQPEGMGVRGRGFGSPNTIRTYSLLVNSRMFCLLLVT